jgi:hypothetical protein
MQDVRILAQDNGLRKLRGIGSKTVNEIKTMITCYEAMDERCKQALKGDKPMTTALEQHFTQMQTMAMHYLMPAPYTDRDGHMSNGGVSRETLFINDMIYMLDGPEQRVAQSAGGGVDITESVLEIRDRTRHMLDEDVQGSILALVRIAQQLADKLNG